jgi:hypothetical protein
MHIGASLYSNLSMSRCQSWCGIRLYDVELSRIENSLYYISIGAKYVIVINPLVGIPPLLVTSTNIF